MVIGVCGLIETGSSAVCDYLKEFDNICGIDRMEFVIPYFPDGLDDLDYHLNRNGYKYMSSTVAIERFRNMMYSYFINTKKAKGKEAALTAALDEFTEQITQVEWSGYGKSDYVMMGPSALRWTKFKRSVIYWALDRLFKSSVDKPDWHIMRFASKVEDFDIYARNFIHKVLEAYGADFNKIVMLDQPFAGNDPVSSFKYFDDPRAIVVDRDPRDQYMSAKKFLRRKGRMIPTESVEKFVEFYKNMRGNQPYKLDDSRVLRINFEDLIYEYEQTTGRIKNFINADLGSQSRHIFEPGMSINNTQIFKRFPQYAGEINYIEEQLAEYLYPFEKYGDVEIDGQMFAGRSPLNKKQ